VENHGLSAYQQGLVKGLRFSAAGTLPQAQGPRAPEQVDAGDMGGVREPVGALQQAPAQPAPPSSATAWAPVRSAGGGVAAAAAMEAASAGSRTAKLAKLRRSVEGSSGSRGAAMGICGNTQPCAWTLRGRGEREGQLLLSQEFHKGQYRKASGVAEE